MNDVSFWKHERALDELERLRIECKKLKAELQSKDEQLVIASKKIVQLEADLKEVILDSLKYKFPLVKTKPD
jgi:chromosome segregation ATPase